MKIPYGASSSSSAPVDFASYEDFEYEFVEEVERLSNWELLDVSDATDSEMDGNGGESSRVSEDLLERISTVVTVPISLVADLIGNVYLLQKMEEGGYAVAEEDETETGGGDDDEGDVFDLDNELIPWSVSDKVGRQRMRKLGKRGFAKMYNSKRSSFLFTKAGCVRGKHGLDLKHR